MTGIGRDLGSTKHTLSVDSEFFFVLDKILQNSFLGDPVHMHKRLHAMQCHNSIYMYIHKLISGLQTIFICAGQNKWLARESVNKVNELFRIA